MADTLTFPVTLPREFVTLLGAPAQAAELLGLNRRGFVSLLARKGIDYFRLTPDEWAEEVARVNDRSTPRG